MKTRKRTLIKTALLSLVRYERWKMNPKNIERIIQSEQWKHGLWFTWMLCLAFFMVSCGTTTKVTKTKAETAISSDIQVKKNLEQTNTSTTVDKSVTANTNVEEKSLIQIEKETEEFEARLITYDTSLPVDEKTGKPPAKSELIWTNKKNNEKKSNQISTVSESTKTSTDLNVDLKNFIKQKSDSFARVKAKSKSEVSITEKVFSNKLWIMLIVLVVGIAAFFVLKKITPLGLFLKIKNFFHKT